MTNFFFLSRSQGWCVRLMVVFRFGKDIGSHMSLYAAGRLFIFSYREKCRKLYKRVHPFPRSAVLKLFGLIHKKY